MKLTKAASGFSTEVSIGPLELSQGYHNITIEAETGNARFQYGYAKKYVNATGMQFHNPAVRSSQLQHAVGL